MVTVGICEDDDALRQILRSALERADCDVRATASGVEAVRAFTEEVPQVLVLDIGLPDADGRDVCQALRARGVRAPVLFLTARDAVTDRLSGFHAGGDDYLVKPFALAELVVRVQALARRATAPGLGSESDRPPAAAALGSLLDPSFHVIRAQAGGEAVHLTPTEYRLLAAICAGHGRIVRRGTLLSAAWPDGASVSENTLDAYVSRLRGKLRAAQRPEQIENVRGVGYRITP
jgi:two-component system response regulator MprA